MRADVMPSVILRSRAGFSPSTTERSNASVTIPTAGPSTRTCRAAFTGVGSAGSVRDDLRAVSERYARARCRRRSAHARLLDRQEVDRRRSAKPVRTSGSSPTRSRPASPRAVNSGDAGDPYPGSLLCDAHLIGVRFRPDTFAVRTGCRSLRVRNEPRWGSLPSCRRCSDTPPSLRAPKERRPSAGSARRSRENGAANAREEMTGTQPRRGSLSSYPSRRFRLRSK